MFVWWGSLESGGGILESEGGKWLYWKSLAGEWFWK